MKKRSAEKDQNDAEYLTRPARGVNLGPFFWAERKVIHQYIIFTAKNYLHSYQQNASINGFSLLFTFFLTSEFTCTSQIPVVEMHFVRPG